MTFDTIAKKFQQDGFVVVCGLFDAVLLGHVATELERVVEVASGTVSHADQR